jgi:cytochrome c oxidase assembly protein subunit 15
MAVLLIILIYSMPMANSYSYNIGLSYFTKLLVFSVALLIFIGALVTSHQAGLSVPDWPTTFGYNMFLYPLEKWTGGIFYEHSHRLVASFIGLLTVILFAWTALAEKRKWVKKLSALALVAVICQGILGGLTVLYLLPTAISVSHAVLGQTFLVIVLSLAYIQSYEYLNLANSKAHVEELRKVAKISTFCAFIIYLQLIFGALMRHTHSGLAIPDFPTTGGKWLPIFSNETLHNINTQLRAMSFPLVDMTQVYIHSVHRFFAFFVTFVVFYTAYKALSQIELKVIKNNIKFLLVLVITQFALGIFTIWSGKQPVITSLHVVTGALLLATITLLSLRSWKLYYNKLETK